MFAFLEHMKIVDAAWLVVPLGSFWSTFRCYMACYSSWHCTSHPAYKNDVFHLPDACGPPCNDMLVTTYDRRRMLRGVMAWSSQYMAQITKPENSSVCFLCLWGRVIPLADNEQETSLEVWRRRLSQQACRKMLKTALQSPRWFTNVCYRVSLIALHSESALSVCKAALCRNKIVQGRLGPLRAEYPSLHAPGLLNLVGQRLQDNIYNTEPSCQVTSTWL